MLEPTVEVTIPDLYCVGCKDYTPNHDVAYSTTTIRGKERTRINAICKSKPDKEHKKGYLVKIEEDQPTEFENKENVPREEKTIKTPKVKKPKNKRQKDNLDREFEMFKLFKSLYSK